MTKHLLKENVERVETSLSVTLAGSCQLESEAPFKSLLEHVAGNAAKTIVVQSQES